ncbi:MAG TPA: PA2778 family cysteine peptidase [Moraxellaceae bacterium]|nr:PA2778 family cysteine peptidase [Moraxellaceae bacterium]
MNKVVVPVVLLVLSLAGCSAPQTVALRKAPAADNAGIVELRDVPFLSQDAQHGGPAALAMMLVQSGRKVTLADIAARLQVPDDPDVLAVALAAEARRQGRVVYSIAPTLDSVLTAIHQGYPVLVLQNRGISLVPLWRYAVVIGADRAHEVFWLRSGSTERLAMSFASFERAWGRANHFGFLIMDPAAIPDNLEPRAVIRELALMEQAGAATDAQAGFNRALLNWPEQKTAWLGLASSSMQLGQIDRAESVLRELVRREPGYGAGLNNLADLLLRTGRPLEALPFAERAVRVLDIPETRATLAAAHQALEPIQSEALPAEPGDITPADIRSAMPGSSTSGRSRSK